MADISGLLRKEGGPGGKVRWHLNHWLLRRLGLVRRAGMTVTVWDSFGAPGDTLLTGIVCRHIAERFPGIRINCITPNPELLAHDPHIARLNGPETFVCLRHWYLDMLTTKDGTANALDQSMRALGFREHDFRCAVYLTEAERREGLARLEGLARPIVSINTRSKEPVKNWPEDRWRDLVARLRERYDIVQLGDAAELSVEGVRGFGGRLSPRESMAVLAHARVHVGPDSFLMHAARGLGVPSVILFGGSRTPANVGYPENVNLYVAMPCGPCFIHAGRGEACAHDVECMRRIGVDEVRAHVDALMQGRGA